MADLPDEKVHKSRKKSKTIETSRKTSRVYELAVACFNAAKHGNVDDLRFILSAETCPSNEEFNALISSKDKEGNTLILKCIHGAASRQIDSHSNFTECLSFLASSGVDVNAQDGVGRTALHWCVLYGRVDFLAILQVSGGNFTILDGTGLSPLHLAIGIRSEKLRYKFIDFICSSASKEILEALDGHNRSLLYLALSVSAFKTFEFLLESKANPDGLGPDGRKLIIHSIEKGLGKFTELLLRHGASLSSKDPDGFTAIHLAACQENPESIYVLTETVNKTLLNVKDKLGRTPLIYACLMGFDKNVELLLAQKIWILDQDNEGKTALHHTVNNTHRGCAELLCKENKKIIDIGDAEGHTAAHDTVIAGNVTILTSLLENGCNIAVRDNGGHSLVHWATAYGTLNCFEKLLDYEASIDKEDNHGATPLHYGCQNDESEKINYGRCEIVNVLLQRGVKLDVVDKEGRRPIHWAASSGNVAVMKILLRNGDDVNARTFEEQMTPIHLASFQGIEKAVEFLVTQNGTELDPQDKRKCTPLFYACSSGHAGVAQVLLRCGVDRNATNELGESPSHGAAVIGSVECLELLCKYGANLNLLNNQNDAPLHEAASAGKTAAVRFLLENNCQPTVKNSTGATPLHYSVAEGYAGITRALLEKGACVNALVTTNETDFVTPLDIALGNSDHEQIQLLQTFGARTGHSIIDNSALVIQHRWKIFKRRFSAVDSIYRSNLSDSVSNHERCDSMKKENRQFAKKEVKQRANSYSLDQRFDDNRTRSDYDCDDVADDDVAAVDAEDEYTENGDVFENDGRKEASFENHEPVLNHSFLSKDNKNQYSSFDKRIVDNLKKEVMERSESNISECNRTDHLTERVEKLRRQIQQVGQEVKDISSSKKFQIVVRYNDRMSRQQKEHIAPLCKLPNIPPTSSKRYTPLFISKKNL